MPLGCSHRTEVITPARPLIEYLLIEQVRLRSSNNYTNRKLKQEILAVNFKPVFLPVKCIIEGDIILKIF